MISCKNGSHVLIVFLVIFEKWLNMKKKNFMQGQSMYECVTLQLSGNGHDMR